MNSIAGVQVAPVRRIGRRPTSTTTCAAHAHAGASVHIDAVVVVAADIVGSRVRHRIVGDGYPASRIVEDGIAQNDRLGVSGQFDAVCGVVHYRVWIRAIGADAGRASFGNTDTGEIIPDGVVLEDGEGATLYRDARIVGILDDVVLYLHGCTEGNKDAQCVTTDRATAVEVLDANIVTIDEKRSRAAGSNDGCRPLPVWAMRAQTNGMILLS